jgi:hypothetical protein
MDISALLAQEPRFHFWLMFAFLALAAVVFPFLLFVTAPYGRHTRKGWGPRINDTVGWVIMEAPAPILFALFFFLGNRTTSVLPIVFLCIYELHYINRTFIFPFRLRGNRKDMPISIMLSGALFNTLNAYIISRWINTLGPEYALSWLWDPRFIIGVVIFFAGFRINTHSDSILRNLLKPGETGYKIPRGGMFKYVSGANYLGELMEWLGYAIATWSLPGLVFFLWTAANLAPRALSSHKWYRETFPEYPKDRKALIPFII